MAQVNEKASKKELIEAYKDLAKKYESISDSSKKEKATKVEEKEVIVKKATALKSDKVIQGLTELKLEISRMFTEIGEKVTEREKELHSLEQAIEIETKRLAEIHQIRAEADTLSELMRLHQEEIRAHKESLEHLEAEHEKRETTLTGEYDERKTALESQRKKEEEEYNYTLKQRRRKDTDVLSEDLTKKRREFEDEVASRETEIAAREKALKELETEFKRLKTEADSFEKRTEERVRAAEKKVRDELEREFNHEKAILEKTRESEVGLLSLNVKNLTNALERLHTENEQLKNDLKDAARQVQSIAVKTIEGHTGHRALEAINTIALEQARSGKKKKDEE
jgi:hypothetical protein